MISLSQLQEIHTKLWDCSTRTLFDMTVEEMREAVTKMNIEHEAVWSTRIYLPFLLCPSKVQEFNEFCDMIEMQFNGCRDVEYEMGLVSKRVSELHTSLNRLRKEAREVFSNLKTSGRQSWNKNNKAVKKYQGLVKRCWTLIEECEKVNTIEKANYDCFVGCLKEISAVIERDFCPFLYTGYHRAFL